MAGPLDHQVGIATETTYNTPVTPTRFYEWDMSKSKHGWDAKPVDGTGMQVGSGGFARADRSVSVVGQGTGNLALDATSKGMGLLWQAGFGTATSTLVSGTVYQQVFSTNLTTALLPALTIQYGIVESVAAGTVDPYTYAGCTITSLELSCGTGSQAQADFSWDAASVATATALATASYPSLLAPFHFGQGAATVGGAVTNPTTTAIASGGTAVTSLRDFTLSLDNGANVDRWRFGGRNQPRVARRKASIKATMEYDSTTIRDAIINYTTVPVVLTFTSTEALSTGFATLQVVAPACKVTGDLPDPSDDPTYDVTFEVKQPTSGSALYVVLRTADAAL